MRRFRIWKGPGDAKMSTYRCPNCKKVFEKEDMEAVFCPHCPTTLCECIRKRTEESAPEKQNLRKILLCLKTLLLSAFLAWVFCFLILPLWMGPEPSATGLLLLGPLWCCVSAPLFRLFAGEEFSVRTGILAAAFWLFTFLFVLILALDAQSGAVSAAGLLNWKTPFAFVPGGYIAYRAGSVENWLQSILSARKAFKGGE